MPSVHQAVRLIKEHGLKAAIRAVILLTRRRIYDLEDVWYDLKGGLNAHGIVELENLRIQSPNKLRGIHYEPTRTRSFVKLMNALNRPPGSVFVDFGSGKGRVLCLASLYSFKRVVGIEFSHELCEEAKRNVRYFQAAKRATTPVEVVEADAVEYQIREDENFFYLYNPFDGVVLERIIGNIVKSKRIHPRNIWLIYCNPVWHEVVEKFSEFQLTQKVVDRAREFWLYQTRS